MIDPSNYYNVQGWMVSELGLKGNALAVYAIIYGFSQDGVSAYSGSAGYLSEWLNCSKRTVLSVLATLTEQGHLKKKTVNKNGVIFNDYVAVRKRPNAQPQTGEEISPPVKNFHGGGEKNDPDPVKNFHGGGENSSPHIYSHNNIQTSNDINMGDADAPTPPAPEKKKGKKKADGEQPEKKPHGEYKHVMLTDEECKKLVASFGTELAAAAVKYLDEYIEEKPKYKSDSHYLAIRRWVIDAVKEKAQRSAQTRPAYPAQCGGRPGTVGPNGIAINQAPADMDGAF